ncbi:MAG TPA: DNA polymerase III subunit beta [Candidatus Obscuribacterales bacterium]
MHFAVQKDLVVKALKDVTSAVATRVVQPILSNVLVDTVDNTTLRFAATDLDLAIETRCPGVVYTPGSITLPGKKLLEVVSKLPNDLVSFQVNKETSETHITCQRSKFTLSGLPADDFPKLVDSRSVEGVVMPSDILRRAIVQTAFAAASYDTSNVLGGVYLLIADGVLEATATDGSRLAHRRDELLVNSPSARRAEADKETESEPKSQVATLEKPLTLKAIVPARACGELLKLIDFKELCDIRLAVVDGQITFETESHFLSSRLIGGEYPRYHELFPSECKYLARFKRQEVADAIERVAVMSDERTHLVKLHFEPETLQISSNTPDVGRAQEELSITLDGQVIDVALNVRYVLDVLQRLATDDVHLEMTGPLKPLIFKGVGDENYKYLLMPVQAR